MNFNYGKLYDCLKLCHLLSICCTSKKKNARVRFKRDKSLFEQLVERDAGQSPNIMSVPLKSGQLATMHSLGMWSGTLINTHCGNYQLQGGHAFSSVCLLFVCFVVYLFVY